MNTSIHEKVKDFIKENQDVVNYTRNELKSEELKIFISEEKIPFNLPSLEVSILKSDYIKGFNEFNDYNNNNEKSIIKRVNDSLYQRNLILNKEFEVKNSNKIFNIMTMKEYNYILFFSDIKDGQVFAQLIPYNYEINKNINFKDVSFGLGFSFLFNIDNESNIVKEYSDRVNFN